MRSVGADVALVAGTRRWAPAGVAFAAATGCLIVGTYDPAGGSYPLACPFKILTGGLDCPGCGATRATHHLLNGRVSTAAGYNVLFLVALPLLVWAWAAWAFPGRVPRFRLPARVVWAIPFVVGAFWILRNLPWAPFTTLHT